jgi:hypothetical protein
MVAHDEVSTTLRKQVGLLVTLPMRFDHPLTQVVLTSTLNENFR